MQDIFVGFVVLGDTLTGLLLAENASAVPVNADALPTFRAYGPSGFVISGTASFRDTGSITGATNANPIVITTSTAHGLTTGARVTITGVGGNTAANTTATITVLSTTTFSLDSVAGNGAYTSGGTWNVTGAYKYQIVASEANGFAAGKNYSVLHTFAIATVQKGVVASFIVV